ncbi:MAG: transporter ATP-binding protein [Anaerocolumna sp.]|nr:transporter ATP-binding protein [Anaerocolumna sp.]
MLKDINCSIDNASILGIHCRDRNMCENLLYTLGGLRDFDGSICIDGIDLKSNINEYKMNIDIIQNEIHESSLKAEDYIVFYGMVRGVYNNEFYKRMEKIFKQLNLEHVRKKPMNQLPVGEQKLIRSIAANIKQSKLIIYDNVFCGMDNNSQEKIRDLINRYIKSNYFICILITEEMDGLRDFVDSIYIIQ